MMIQNSLSPHPRRPAGRHPRAPLATAFLLALTSGGAATFAQSNQPKAPAPTPIQAKADQAAGASPWAAIADQFAGYKADTKPSRDAVMQFSLSTEVKDVLVQGGQRVKRGDILMRARDAEILAAKERQKIIAESTTEVDNATKQLELARFKFQKLKEGGTFSQSEFEELRIQSESAALQLEQAKINRTTQQVALQQIVGQAERFYLEAPFDGVIEEVMVEVGQGVTEQEKILRIVNTDRLWLDAYADTSETIRLGLKADAPAWVLVDLADAPKLIRGRVLYVSPVADSVSQTRRVRVEIENPDGWPAGTQARVRFSDPGTQWERYELKAKPKSGQLSFEPSDELGREVESSIGLDGASATDRAIVSGLFARGSARAARAFEQQVSRYRYLSGMSWEFEPSVRVWGFGVNEVDFDRYFTPSGVAALEKQLDDRGSAEYRHRLNAPWFGPAPATSLVLGGAAQ